ncbi:MULTISPECIES: hypothetical protein [Bacillales]|uniref:DUF4268 domain-containing protein n=1 Tax=Ureibacillus massiliensis 4400831 = CIP 108448 = CCUG 49529 TaxID=1211035 RepID=A0A0A3J2C2_9BACL|nr:MULTISPECIES: hypothetical protein [Bacillales]KGR89845.1 hypothetical protein CD30_14730 [Ureibacillus massiliensis 4400831 = CIP 108448 = CCUG 49529]
MSKNGSIKEAIFTVFLKLNLSIMEKELSLHFSEVVLEQSFDVTEENDSQNKRVLMLDMYGMEQNSNVEVIVENVLTKSNNDHQRRLLKIIERLEKGIIIYQALGFRPKDVQQLKNAVKGKDINLYFVQINEDMIPLINNLNTETHKLRIYENLNVLNTVVKPISLLKDISVIKPIQGNVALMREEVERDFSNPHVEANNYLLDQLQTNIPYFFPFQRRKNLANRYISFGFGKSGVSLLLSVEDMRHRAFVKLTFRELSPPIYYKIKEREDKARELIGEELQFLDDKHTIEFRFKPYQDVRDTVDTLVDVAEKFILTFSNQVLYGADRFGMQEEGLEYRLS